MDKNKKIIDTINGFRAFDYFKDKFYDFSYDMFEDNFLKESPYLSDIGFQSVVEGNKSHMNFHCKGYDDFEEFKMCFNLGIFVFRSFVELITFYLDNCSKSMKRTDEDLRNVFLGDGKFYEKIYEVKLYHRRVGNEKLSEDVKSIIKSRYLFFRELENVNFVYEYEDGDDERLESKYGDVAKFLKRCYEIYISAVFVGFLTLDLYLEGKIIENELEKGS